MAEGSLKDLVRAILSSGLALAGSSRTLPAAPARHLPIEEPNADRAVTMADATRSDVVIRAARPKVLLRALDTTRVTLISSHRSHRSHSSHRSHYSGSGTPATPPKPDTARPRPTDTGTARAKGLVGGAGDTSVLGSRVLVRGMRGKDVEQLIVLMLKNSLLKPDQVPSESLFTADMETAVKAFQSRKGVTADGRVDYRTLLLLKAQ